MEFCAAVRIRMSEHLINAGGNAVALVTVNRKLKSDEKEPSAYVIN